MTIHITACVRKFLKCLYTLMIGMHCFWASCRVQIPLVRSGNMGACCLLKLRSVGFSRRNWFTSNGMVHARNFNLIYVVLLTSTPPLLSPLPVPLPLSPPLPSLSRQPHSRTNTFKAYVIQIKFRNENCWYIKYSLFIDVSSPPLPRRYRLKLENRTVHVLKECYMERAAKSNRTC